MVNKDLLLTREELRDLRKEIVLNSLYTSDYENTHHILPRDAQNFFDGYVEYLYELAEENGEEPDIHDLCIKYDNADNLENWYYCFDENPLLNYVEKMRPLFKKENFVLTYDKKNMIYIFSKMSPAGQDFNVVILKILPETFIRRLWIMMCLMKLIYGLIIQVMVKTERLSTLKTFSKILKHVSSIFKMHILLCVVI